MARVINEPLLYELQLELNFRFDFCRSVALKISVSVGVYFLKRQYNFTNSSNKAVYAYISFTQLSPQIFIIRKNVWNEIYSVSKVYDHQQIHQDYVYFFSIESHIFYA